MAKGNKSIEANTAKEIEVAVVFLVSSYCASGRNPKPVILHSLRIAFRLLELGYSSRVVIAAILHDLVEDSDVSIEDIKRNFGKKIGNMVAAVSFDPTITDRKQRCLEMLKRVKREGREAMILKAADLYDNSFYIHLAENVTEQKYLIWKLETFLKLASQIKNEGVWKSLKKRLPKEKERLSSLLSNRQG